VCEVPSLDSETLGNLEEYLRFELYANPKDKCFILFGRSEDIGMLKESPSSKISSPLGRKSSQLIG
jgi:hypothetical protein